MISFLTNVIAKRTSHNAAWWTDFLPDGGEGLWAVKGPADITAACWRDGDGRRGWEYCYKATEGAQDMETRHQV